MKKIIGAIYKKIAEVCLKSWYADMSEQERNDLLDRGDYDEIESYIYAESSIKAAIKGLTISLQKPLPEGFENFVLFGESLDGQQEVSLVKQKELLINSSPSVQDNITLSALASIHDQWVRDNTKKFFDPSRQDRQYMFTDILLIGWKEAKKDLIFLSPIAEFLGLPLDHLEATYQARSDCFIAIHELTANTLANFISTGSEAYYALDDSISEELRRNPEACQRIAEQIIERINLC